MMRRNALAMGAAVLAVVPVVMSCPVSASAEYLPSWEQFKSLYDYNLTDPTIKFLYGDPVVGIWWKYYYSALYAIVEGVYINGNYEITPGDFAGMSGYYLVDGSQRFGAIYAGGVSTVMGSAGAPSDPVALVALQDGTLSLRLAPNSGSDVSYTIQHSLLNGGFTGLSLYYERTSGRLQSSIIYEGTGIFDTYSYGVSTAFSNSRYIRCNPSGDPVEFTTTIDYLAANTSGGRVLLGRSLTFSSLPVSDAYPTITADNALDYVSDVLNPYMSENAPDTVPYLFNPYGDEPVYPTGETVQGIPKAWTVENPRLPSYSLDLQLPTADFDAVDVSTPLEHHATGLRFWWALLGECLDHFGVKELVIFALALGLIVTILTRLGR